MVGIGFVCATARDLGPPGSVRLGLARQIGFVCTSAFRTGRRGLALLPRSSPGWPINHNLFSFNHLRSNWVCLYTRPRWQLCQLAGGKLGLFGAFRPPQAKGARPNWVCLAESGGPLWVRTNPQSNDWLCFPKRGIEAMSHDRRWVGMVGIPRPHAGPKIGFVRTAAFRRLLTTGHRLPSSGFVWHVSPRLLLPLSKS